MTERERQRRHNAEYARGLYSLGWLVGFSAILWALVGDKLSDETVAEYEAHVKRLRKSVGMEGLEEWKS